MPRAVLLPGPESAGLPSISTFSGLYFDAGGRCKAESPEHSASISLQHVIQKKSTAPLWCSLPGSLIPGALPANSLCLLLLSWALFCTEQEQRHSSGHLARHFCRFTAVLGRAGSGLCCACAQVAAWLHTDRWAGLRLPEGAGMGKSVPADGNPPECWGSRNQRCG